MDFETGYWRLGTAGYRRVYKDAKVKQERDILSGNSGRELGAIKPE